MKPSTTSVGLVALLIVGCAAAESEAPPQDAAVLEAILVLCSQSLFRFVDLGDDGFG